MKFDILVHSIQDTHNFLHANVLKSINKQLTIRNWLIGFYIYEFEQKGEDRAKYGTKLVDELASKMAIKGLSSRNLKLFRQFYSIYPQLGLVLGQELKSLNIYPQSLGLLNTNISNNTIELLSENVLESQDYQPFGIVQSITAQLPSDLQVPMEKLIDRLSFTHLALLLPIDNALKRVYYELECIKGNWSVGELKRQINSLFFERSEISLNPAKLTSLIQTNSDKFVPKDIIKSPFTFEFLGLKAKDVVYESDLEQALIDNLEAFLLELGHGFCFEAKQKRITIGDKYYFIDLVFYHRVLKCHVLIELKMKEVEHEHIGQLKTYINYYKKNIQLPGDNPPVGILLVTENDKALVEYAIADSDQQLFVSKYQLELPTKEQLIEFIKSEIKSV